MRKYSLLSANHKIWHRAIFTENTSIGESSTSGGAISASGALTISGNDSVLFQKNASVSSAGYVLCSIVCNALNLSADAGHSILVRDTIKANGSTTALNQNGRGEITFTGETTAVDLNALLAENEEGRSATEEEIQNSHTSKLGTTTTLYGGTLNIQDGAEVFAESFKTSDDAQATVLLHDGLLFGRTLTIGSGSNLVMEGCSRVGATLITASDGVTATIDVSRLTAGKEEAGILGALATSSIQLSLTGSLPTEQGVYILWSGPETLNDGSKTQDVLTLIANDEITKLIGTDIRWDNGNLVFFNGVENNGVYIREGTSHLADIGQSWLYATDIVFRNNHSVGEGGALYEYAYSHPWRFNRCNSVLFDSNSSQAEGGAIYSSDKNTLSFDYNTNVTFTGNTASREGGALFALVGTLSISNNGVVLFEDNATNGESSRYGGAMYLGEETVTIENNKQIVFRGNTAAAADGEDSYYSRGGAISSINSYLTFSDNDNILFDGNVARGAYSYSGGGSSGGALDVYYLSCMAFSNNQQISFCNNTVQNNWGHTWGGAVEVWAWSSFTMSGNGQVTFSDNTARAIETADSTIVAGGAIFAGGTSYLTIDGNQSVLFERNSEILGDTYRLRSIYAMRGASLRLSANVGQTITFRDSIYGDENTTTTLNGNGAGDIIFTGATTVADLQSVIDKNTGWKETDGEAARRTATDEEIANSRTSELLGTTTLRQGTLHVEDGAILNTAGLSTSTGANATIALKDGALNAVENSVTLTSGATLSLTGANTMTVGTLNMQDGSSFLFTPTEASQSGALLELTGKLVTGKITLSFNTDSLVKGQSYKLLSLADASDYNAEVWTADNVTLSDTKNSFDNLAWADGCLTFTYNPYSAGNDEHQGDTQHDETSTDISDHEIVSYDHNHHEGSDTEHGGAFDTHGHELDFRHNREVRFSGNVVQGDGAHGGAIYSDNRLSFSRNESVVFQGNAEINGSEYRLRSIYSEGTEEAPAELNLTTTNAGHSIEFRDSIYANEHTVTKLNEGGAGTINFTGESTEADLQSVAGRAGTEAEITASRTSELHGDTTLYGGHLVISENAILNIDRLSVEGGQITVATGAQLNLGKADITIPALTLGGGSVTLGTENDHAATLTTTTLTVSAASQLNADLVMTSGKLTFTDGAILTMGCSVTLGDGVVVVLDDEVISALASGTQTSLTLMDSAEEISLGEVSIQNEAGEAAPTCVKVEKKGASLVVTPEPATATLSLLALAGLAARRRRLR